METAGPPKSILIIRLSAIGDNVFSSSIIAPMRARFPDARIYWMCQRESRALVEANPNLDGVLEFPKKRFAELLGKRKYLTFLREARVFVKELRSHSFDLVVDLQGLMKSGVVAFLSGGRRRVGLGSKEGSQMLMHEVVPRRVNDEDLNAEYRDLACHLGLPEDRFGMELAVRPSDRAAVDNVVRRYGLEGGWIAAIPFTTRPQKHWFEVSWSALIPQLYRRTGKRVALLGGPRDAEAAHRILSRVGEPEACIDLTGENCLSIGEASAFIARAVVCIGVDTGMTHMSIAHRRPTVCLFGSTLPYLETGLQQVRVHYHRLECSPCRRRPTCNGAFTCMQLISPATVLESALDLMGKGSSEWARRDHA